MSYYSRAGSGRSAGTSTYIWDELDQEVRTPESRLDVGYLDSNESIASMPSSSSRNNDYTISNIESALSQFSDYTEENVEESFSKWKLSSMPTTGASSSDGGTLDIAQSIEIKIQKLKAQLDEKLSVCRDLHDQLLRLRTAKEKRVEKMTNQWVHQWETLKSENKKASEKLTSFVERVKGEIRVLSEKQDALKEKKEGFQIEIEKSIVRLEKELEYQRGRVLQQLKVEEKASLDKAVSTKSETMKKHIEASLAPQLDKLVRDGKTEAMERKMRLKEELQNLKQCLQIECAEKLTEYTDALRKQMRGEMESHKQQSDKHLQEETETLNRQQRTAKERFDREKVQLEDLNEQQRKAEKLQHLDTMQEMGKADNVTIQEYLAKHQREMDEVLQANKEEEDNLVVMLRNELLLEEELYRGST